MITVASCGMRFAVAGILLLALTAPAGAATVQGIASVVDGDTLVVQGERIRLHGIDAPEATQTCQRSSGKKWPCGKGAADALTDYISRRLVICEGRDRDDSGRLIAVCSVDLVEINRWLVTEGLAVAFRKHSMSYVDAEAQARDHEAGIWSGKFEMPWDYRKRRWAEVGSLAPDPNCPIKGDINKKGERIYHTPWGSRTYKRTKINTAKGERWFCDEAEAVAAGWRAPFN